MNLVESLGTSEKIISGRPETSYFIQRYAKSSQLSNQIISIPLDTAINFGEEFTMKIYQEADLVTGAYLEFKYPSGQPPAVCDSFGTYMFNWIQLEYGDQILERIDGEFLEIMNDLTVPQGKQGALSNLVGKNLTSNLSVYITRLSFDMFKKGMPICALKEDPHIRFSLRNFNEGCPTATNTNPPFSAQLFVNYVFLPEPERNYFIKNPLTYLFEQTQRFDTTLGKSNCTVLTDFQNCTKELFIVIQSSIGLPYQWTDVLRYMRLVLNGTEIIPYDIGTSLFMRCLQPLENHTRAPDRNFYMYPFAIDPENDDPTGTVNLTGLKQQFDFVLLPSRYPNIVHIHTKTYNVLKIQDGLLGVLFPVPFITAGFSNPETIISEQLLGIVTTLAGTAGSGGTANGTGTAARFLSTYGAACDTSGNIYVTGTTTLAVAGTKTVRKIVSSTGVVTTLASFDRFSDPRGIACDTSGNIYVADSYYSVIYKIVASTGVVTTFAGLAGSTGSANGTGSGARFNAPWGVACDTSGNIFVADTSNSTIRKIVASSAVVTTLAGTAGSIGTSDGTGTAARFNLPQGIACDTSGNIYVADTSNSTIRKIVASTAVVTTLAGFPLSTGSTDGTGTAARFYAPVGIASDTYGNVYVADTSNSTIRKIIASSAVVTTLAGAALSTGSTDGPGTIARFNTPYAIACDPGGTVYVGDTTNYTIRKVVTYIQPYNQPLVFGFVSNPGTITLYTLLQAQSLSLFIIMSGPIPGFVPTWSYPTIAGVTWATSTTGIMLTVAQGVAVTTRNITVTASYAGFSYPQTFSFTVNNTPRFVLSNPGTTTLYTVAALQPLSLTLTNPYSLTPSWTYPTIAGVTWATSTTGITLTVAQGTAVTTRGVTVTASYGVFSYPQTFSLTVDNTPNFVLSNPGTTTLYTLAVQQPLPLTLTNPLSLTPTWSYPTIAGVSWVTSTTGITLTVAQGTAVATTPVLVSASYSTFIYPQTFSLTADNTPRFVLSNPGTTTLYTIVAQQPLTLTLTNPYSLTPSWSYPTITGVTWATSTTGITLTVAQGTAVTTQDVTVSASYGAFPPYPQTFSLTADNTPRFVLSNPGTTLLNTYGAPRPVSLTLTNPFSLTPSWSYPTITGVSWAPSISGITLTVGQGVAVTTRTVTVTASYSTFPYPQSFSLTADNTLVITGAVTTFAGLAGSTGSNDGTGSAAQFFYPCGVASDSGGNIYVADTNNCTIRKIVASTGVVTTLAGLAGSIGTSDGTGSGARFSFPQGIACDTSGNIYVADTSNSTIRKIVASTGVVTTLAGLAGSPGFNDGTGTGAKFSNPISIVCDTSGNIFVADTSNHTIRKIVASTAVVTTLAGLAQTSGSNDGTGTAARFYYPYGVTCDTSGNIFVADTYNYTIRKIVASTAVVTTLAGTPGISYEVDGTGSGAYFNNPVGITCDTGGNIFVTDSSGQTIRKIITSTGVVTTLAGTGNAGGSSDGTGSAARFYYPSSIAFNASTSALYVADKNNSTIRKIT
jgi:sugar lactone lactonase YvrE